MKLLSIILLIFTLAGCTSENVSPTGSPVTTPATTDGTRSEIVRKIEADDIIFDDLANDGVGSILTDKVTMTANSRNGIAIVKDNALYLQNADGSQEIMVDDLNDIKGIAWHTDCGGNDIFSALHNDGTVSEFSVYLEDYEDPMSYTVSNVFRPQLEGVTDIKGYDDTNPLTTCGNATFYYVLSDGSEVNGNGYTREEFHPYVSFIEFSTENENKGASAGIKNYDVLYIFADGTLFKGKAYFEDLRELIRLESYDEKLTYNNEDITVDKLSIYADSDYNVYILADDETLYVVDKDFSISGYANASITYEGYDAYDNLAEIAFTSDDGDVVINNGYPINKAINYNNTSFFSAN